MSLVGKYKRGGSWYLRYAKSIGLPRRSLRISDGKMAEVIRLQEEHRLLFSSYGITARPCTPIRYSTFVKLFLQYKAGQGRSHNTLESYQYALNNFGLFMERDEFLHAITLDMLEAFAAKRRQDGRAQKTIRNETITLVTAFKWAKRQRYVKESPAEGLEIPKKVSYPPRYLTQSDYLKLKAAIDDEEFRDVVDFYLLTGIRRAEGPALRASKHVDLERGVIILPQSKQGNYKTLPISDDLRNVISRLLMRAKGKEQFIRFEEDNLTKRFGKYVEKAGLPKDITFHALRHTFATWLASVGVSFPMIQTLLGQADPDSTKIYVHPHNADLERAISKLRLPVATPE